MLYIYLCFFLFVLFAIRYSYLCRDHWFAQVAWGTWSFKKAPFELGFRLGDMFMVKGYVMVLVGFKIRNFEVRIRVVVSNEWF